MGGKPFSFLISSLLSVSSALTLFPLQQLFNPEVIRERYTIHGD
jgi:hypothetical protein